MFKTDIWSKEQLADKKHQYCQPRTMSEFLEWYKKEENYGLLNECSTQFPVNYNELKDHPLTTDDFTFKKIAVLDLDLTNIVSSLLDEYKDITSNTSKMRPDLVDSPEKYYHRLHGFDRETNTKKITKETHPDVWKLGEYFDLEKYSVATQYQPPGGMSPRHVDFLDSMWIDFANHGFDFMNQPFNTVTKSPDGYYALRMMIALTPWSTGHVFGFEDTYWNNWSPGEVITFDWAHARHYTANLSFNPRLFVKVSGITQDKNHWIFNSINNSTIKQL
mgnify:CR=1 FL=1|jgi:hypothetical protein